MNHRLKGKDVMMGKGSTSCESLSQEAKKDVGKFDIICRNMAGILFFRFSNIQFKENKFISKCADMGSFSADSNGCCFYHYLFFPASIAGRRTCPLCLNSFITSFYSKSIFRALQVIDSWVCNL